MKMLLTIIILTINLAMGGQTQYEENCTVVEINDNVVTVVTASDNEYCFLVDDNNIKVGEELTLMFDTNGTENKLDDMIIDMKTDGQWTENQTFWTETDEVGISWLHTEYGKMQIR